MNTEFITPANTGQYTSTKATARRLAMLLDLLHDFNQHTCEDGNGIIEICATAHDAIKEGLRRQGWRCTTPKNRQLVQPPRANHVWINYGISRTAPAHRPGKRETENHSFQSRLKLTWEETLDLAFRNAQRIVARKHPGWSLMGCAPHGRGVAAIADHGRPEPK